MYSSGLSGGDPNALQLRSRGGGGNAPMQPATTSVYQMPTMPNQGGGMAAGGSSYGAPAPSFPHSTGGSGVGGGYAPSGGGGAASFYPSSAQGVATGPGGTLAAVNAGFPQATFGGGVGGGLGAPHVHAAPQAQYGGAFARTGNQGELGINLDEAATPSDDPYGANRGPSQRGGSPPMPGIGGGAGGGSAYNRSPTHAMRPSGSFGSAGELTNSADDRLRRKQNAASLSQYLFFMYGMIVLSVCVMLIAWMTMSGAAARYVCVVLSICIFSFLFTLKLTEWIFSRDDANSAMRVISEAIREGSEGFLKVQYTAIGGMALVIALVVGGIYLFRETPSASISPTMLAIVTSISYLIGAFCSGLAGYIGVWVSIRVNIRVAVAASKFSFKDALLLSFRGGAVSACLSASLCILGVTFLYVFCHLFFCTWGALPARHVPLLLVGYGFGGALVALFMQLGGGIYCFPSEETRVLTDRGFLFLDEIQAIPNYEREVKFACYDTRTQRLVYRRARQWKYLPRAAGLVEFTSPDEAKRWAAIEAGDAVHAAQPQPSNHLSLRVTSEHTMRVLLGQSVGGPRQGTKWRAGYQSAHANTLLPTGAPEEGDQVLRFQAHAAQGVGVATPESIELAARLAAELGVAGVASQHALLQAYGCWLALGAATEAPTGHLLFEELSVEAREWLVSVLCQAGLEPGAAGFLVLDGAGGVRVCSSAWARLFAAGARGPALAEWTRACDREQLRAVVFGLWRARASTVASAGVRTVHTTSDAFRDQLLQALLHAGYAAHFESSPACEGWAVYFADPASVDDAVAAECAEPSMPRAAVRKADYSGAAWCLQVDHPDHWIVAQRAHRSSEVDAASGLERRVVTHASRPIIVGNTKAADVGADMVGKVEAGIPEDDPRNPAVIADLVGDNVGDCAGSMADVFESIAAEVIGTMILGAALAHEANLSNPEPWIFFPLIIHALDLVISSAGIMLTIPMSDKEDPLTTMKRAYGACMVLAAVGFMATCRMLLYTEVAPSAWWNYTLCGWIGIGMSFLIIRSTQYYTDPSEAPVKRIAAASQTGHGTNVIAGVSVGLESTCFPTLIIAAALITAFTLGKNSGLPGNSAGVFGTAVATMGMLCTAVFVLSMNNFGPIADNAGGVVEMSSQPHEVRVITDRLDSVGNVTKAASKGYAVGGSALSCFVLFQAFLDEITSYSGAAFDTVNIAKVEVVCGGLLGMMMIFLFAGWSMQSVGATAQKVVWEVRRQFKNRPGIMENTEKPDYETCVAIVTREALKEMVWPALLALLLPVAVGFGFKYIGAMTDRPQLGVEVIAGFMMMGTLAGLLMAMFMDNAGGAWDNAKKLIESQGLKGSEAHKAAVTGDTVGDPFKDTAGPATHVIITTMSTTVLVLAPLFAAATGIVKH